MTISALLHEPPPRQGKRRNPRLQILLDTESIDVSGGSTPILIHNISTSGLLIESARALAQDEEIDVVLPHADTTHACVIWSSGRLFGCQFAAPISAATLSAAKLRSRFGEAAKLAQAPTALTDESFGDRLKRLRTTKGMTQFKLAAMIGVSEPAVCAWEKGKSRPRPNRMQHLAQILGVAPSDLLDPHFQSSLDDVVRQSRDRIARSAGVPVGRVRIAIEL